MSEEKIVASLQELPETEDAPGYVAPGEPGADKSTVSVQC